MIVLFLLACDFGSISGSSAEDSALDTAGGAEEAVSIASCLADGGALVEQRSSEAWSAGIADLELGPEQTLWALGSDGTLLHADPSDLSALSSAGSVSPYNTSLDITGDRILAIGYNGALAGTPGVDPSAWTVVGSVWGDITVSADGAALTYTRAGCGVDYGRIAVDGGGRSAVDMGDTRTYPMGFETLDDGRLVSTNWAGNASGLTVWDGDEVVDTWTFSAIAEWTGVMETMGEVVLLSTAGDYSHGTLERTDLADGTSVSATLPFLSTRAVALDERLSWALDYEGALVAAEGSTVYALGTLGEVTDIVADPEGAWLATSGADGVIRVYGCE